MAMLCPITTRSAALPLILGALALSGWGAFAYAGRSSAAMERKMTEQVSRLGMSVTNSLPNARLQESVGEIQGRLVAAREEQSRSVRARDQARAELASAQQQLAALTKRFEQAQTRGMQARAITPPPAPIRIAQRVKQQVAQAWSALVPVPPTRIPERAKEQAR